MRLKKALSPLYIQLREKTWICLGIWGTTKMSTIREALPSEIASSMNIYIYI
jgi:hypothetical protein